MNICLYSKDLKKTIKFQDEKLKSEKSEKINTLLYKIVHKKIRNQRLIKNYNFTLFKRATKTLIIKAFTLSYFNS